MKSYVIIFCKIKNHVVGKKANFHLTRISRYKKKIKGICDKMNEEMYPGKAF